MTSRRWFAVAATLIVAFGVVAFIVLGRATVTGSPSVRMTAWVKGANLSQAIGTLEDDGKHVTKAISLNKGTTTVHTICAAMADDAQTANDNLPTPDNDVTRYLAKAYDLEYDAAEICYHASATNTKTQTKAAADRAKASGFFDEAIGRIGAMTGSTVPTTTTTVPGTATSLF